MTGPDHLPAVEPSAAALVLERLGEASSTMAAWWPLAQADKVSAADVRWCASAVAEQVIALLRGDHDRAVDLADRVAQVVEDARTVAEGVDAGDLAICAACGDAFEPARGHRCLRS